MEAAAVELVNRLKDIKSKIENTNKKLKAKKKDIKDTSDAQKVRIGMLFDQVRSALTNKEKQMYQEIDKCFEK